MLLDIIIQADAERLAAAKAGPAAGGSTAPSVSKDDLYIRLLKYIPGPLIGIYIMVTNVISSASTGTTEKVIGWAIFAVFLALIVIYLVRRGVHRWEQVLVSALAFVAWAMASPGPFQLIAHWQAYFGTIALAVVAAFFVAFQPPPLPDDVINDMVT